MIPVETVIKEGKRSTERQKRIWEVHRKHIDNLDPETEYRYERMNVKSFDKDGKVCWSKIYKFFHDTSNFILEHSRPVNVIIYLSDWLEDKPYKIEVESKFIKTYRNFGHKEDIVIVHLGRDTAKALRKREFDINDLMIVKDKNTYKYITLIINHRKRDQIIINENKMYARKKYNYIYLGTNIDQLSFNVEHSRNPYSYTINSTVLTVLY